MVLTVSSDSMPAWSLMLAPTGTGSFLLSRNIFYKYKREHVCVCLWGMVEIGQGSAPDGYPCLQQPESLHSRYWIDGQRPTVLSVIWTITITLILKYREDGHP